MALNWQTEYHRYRRYFGDIRHFYEKKKVRIYGEIILSILAITFFLFFAIKPTAVTITKLVKEIDDNQLVSQQLEEKINDLSQAQRVYFEIEPDLHLIEEALPLDSNLSTLVRELEVLAVKTGVQLQAVQFGQVELKDNSAGLGTPEEIGFSVVINGPYQNLKTFLKSLSSLRRVVLLDSFSFRQGKGKDDQGELGLSLNALAFFLREEK